MRTARGAGRAAGRDATGRFDGAFFAAAFVAAGFLAAGFLAVARADDVGAGSDREVCFLALGDRVLELLRGGEAGADVLLLREPVGEDVRVAMAST